MPQAPLEPGEPYLLLRVLKDAGFGGPAAPGITQIR